MEKKAEATKQTEEAKASTALTVPTGVLNEESLRIIGQIITEQDAQKTKDLTYLFNQNQNKKTMVRANRPAANQLAAMPSSMTEKTDSTTP